MKVLCPAKINLTLEVLARQAGGYHGVRSVMVPVNLFDELTIEKSSGLTFTCDDESLASDDNLVVRAMRALPGARACLHLRKRIPSQAGLGGGSSDAAAVLLAAMAGAVPMTDSPDYVTVARSLGSDVPFFLARTAALVEGTGERVTPLGQLPAWHIIIVKPSSGVSTATAYAQVDARSRPIRPRNSSPSLAAVDALQRADFAAVESLLCNDFQEIVAGGSAEVRRAIQALSAAGARVPLLCGSGSAVFALAPDAAVAASIQSRLDLPPDYRVFGAAFAPSTVWRGALR